MGATETLSIDATFTERIIVLVFVNDEDTKRACEGRSDSCRVISRMLADGQKPDDWSALMRNMKSSGSGITDAIS